MHVAKRKQDLANVEHGDIITKSTIFPQSVKKLPSRAVLENHIDEALVLEGSLERVDKGMVQFH